MFARRLYFDPRPASFFLIARHSPYVFFCTTHSFIQCFSRRRFLLVACHTQEGNGASSAMVAAVINDTSAGKKATPSMGIAVSRDRDVRARCDLDNIGHACNNTVGGGGIAAAATPLAKPSGVSGRGGAYVSTKREVHAPRSSDQGLYLTASGPNHELLKKNTIKGAVSMN